MSTITSHTLLSRPARSPGGLFFAVVGLPCASVGKNRPRSICYSVDTKSTDHQFNISPVGMFLLPLCIHTSTPRWEIKDDSKNVRLTLFNMPEGGALPGDFQVAIEDDVLVIRTKNPKLPVEQQEGYDKENVRAELQLRALVVAIPKVNPAFTKEVAIDGK
ncbi:hypothetical protein PVAP13_9NG398714 [Panicum virgatum]|uniref:Uncharacterized protein n=1 Tax=Panicum virgatum TaxID=38727 RepID=A0A8T0MUI1_PANVG|nr:hypothetical protein PVAP13_9NG398714 [Panicum virgatum]